MNRADSIQQAWLQHWQQQGLAVASTKNKIMLFGWEGYTKNGNGFNDVINTFDTIERATAFINSPYMAQANLGTLQVIDMKTLAVLGRFERQRKTDKWSRVA